MPEIKLHKIVFSKEKLNAIPDAERAVVVYAGHISNEINWLKKALLFQQQSGKQIAEKLPENNLTSEERALLDGSTSEMMMIIRLLAGKTFEAIRFLQKNCFKQEWFQKLSDKMEARGKAALAQLNNYLSLTKEELEKNILYLIRHRIAFHYDEDAIQYSVKVPQELDEFVSYLADNVGNTLYRGSEDVVNSYLIELINPDNPEEVIDRLMTETLNVSSWVQEVLGATLTDLIWEYVGKSLPGIGKTEDIKLQVEFIEDQKRPWFVASKKGQ